jgi:hypothetical protein
MSDKQAEKANETKEDVVVEGFGVRGKDFIEIWQSPRSPEEKVRVSRAEFVSFKNGLLATKNEEQEALLESASKRGRYVRSDPEITKPFVCKVQKCGTKWYSSDAFTDHTEFKHTGLFRK